MENVWWGDLANKDKGKDSTFKEWSKTFDQNYEVTWTDQLKGNDKDKDKYKDSDIITLGKFAT